MTLKLKGTNSGSVSLDAPANTTGGAEIAFTLPVADGSANQVLKTDGSGQLSFTTIASDAITEGNTSAEVVDTGSDGHFKVTTEGTERLRIDSSGRLGLASNSPTAQLEIGGSVSLGTIRAAYLRYPADSANYGRTAFEITANESGTEKSVFKIDGRGSIVGNTFEGTVFRNSGTAEIARFDGSGRLLVGTTAAVDSALIQFAGAKTFTGEIPQNQLNVNDTTSLAAGVGGAIGFSGKYHSAGFNTTFGSIEGVKENATDGNYSGALIFRSRQNGGNNLERIRIDSSGRLLVGATTALNSYEGLTAQKLTVAGTAYADSTAAVINYQNDTVGGGLNLGLSRNSTVGSQTIVQNGDQVGIIRFTGSDGSTMKGGAFIRGVVDGAPSSGNVPMAITFATPTERMRIGANGNLAVGTTSTTRRLTVSNSNATEPLCLLTSGGINSDTTGSNRAQIQFGYAGGTSFSQFIKTRHNDGASAGNAIDFYTCNGTSANSITSGTNFVASFYGTRFGIGTQYPNYQLELSADLAAKPSTTTWTVLSDERLKEDIEFANLDTCYEAIKNIPLKRYKWKDAIYSDTVVADRRKLGWIAQDVEQWFPKAVTSKEYKYGPEGGETIVEDCRDLNADQLYAAMYGTIQKLIQKVETLETSNSALEARLTALEGGAN